MSSNDSIELLHKILDSLNRLHERIDHIEAIIGQSSPSQPEWVDKRTAAAIVHRTPRTLDEWRKDFDRGLIEGVHWQFDGWRIMWQREMLTHWYNNRATPEIHAALVQQVAIDRQVGKKRGRPRKDLGA